MMPLATTRRLAPDPWPTAVSEGAVCAADAVRNRPAQTLTAFTHITAGRSHICEMLELAAALGASGMAADPLIHKGLPANVDGQLGPRSKLGGEHQTAHTAGGDRPECEATVTNVRNLELARLGIAAQSDDFNRRALHTAGDGGFEVLQSHVVSSFSLARDRVM